jgi:hypothetical protein
MCPEINAKLFLQAKSDGALMELEFHTVTDYLFLLKEAGLASRVAGDQVMFILAAAVSDFYVPEELMVTNCSFGLLGVPSSASRDTGGAQDSVERRINWVDVGAARCPENAGIVEARMGTKRICGFVQSKPLHWRRFCER